MQIIVKRESKPLGSDMDINTDGEVLVVLDLRADAALLARRTARELVNRFQKLRKKAGLEPSDTVELFYTPPAAAAAAGTSDSDAAAAELAEAITAEEAYLREGLGGAVLPMTARPAGAIVLEREVTSVQLPSDAVAEIEVSLALPAAAVAAAAVEADYGAAAVPAVEAFVASKEVARLKTEAKGGAVTVQLDGAEVKLEVGRHLFWNAERR